MADNVPSTTDAATTPLSIDDVVFSIATQIKQEMLSPTDDESAVLLIEEGHDLLDEAIKQEMLDESAVLLIEKGHDDLDEAIKQEMLDESAVRLLEEGYCPEAEPFSVSVAYVIDEPAAPAIDDSGAPAIDNSKAPAIDDSEAPAIDKSGAPAIDKSAAPAVDESVEPAVDESGAPAIDKSAVDESAEPAVDELAAPAVDELAAPAIEEPGAPAIDESIAPAIDESGAPAIDESGAPAIDESGAPAIDESGAPAIDESGAPAIDNRVESPLNKQVIPPEAMTKKMQKQLDKINAIDNEHCEIVQEFVDESLQKFPITLYRVTCVAPVNIAVIKYWGKRNEKLILPTNDSISGTLNMNEMRARTTIMAGDTFEKDMFWLNGQEVSVDGDRMQNVLYAMRKLAAEKNPDCPIHKMYLHICSENNFPTAAGLASSAAGYACLVYTLGHLFGVHNEDLTPIARMGSGSACRSLHGGFVHWKKGALKTGEDSVAEQVADASHWPEMHVVVVVVADHSKKVSSSMGMRVTRDTSELFKHRIGKCVDERIKRMRKAILAKNFEQFALLTMQDSNQFHAVCMDSYPPIRYLNDTSYKIIDAVHLYNEFKQEIRVAYTFDAGPNACCYMLKKDVTPFISMLNLAFPSDIAHSPKYVRGAPVQYMPYPPKGLFNFPDSSINPPNVLRYIIHTTLGNGPKNLEEIKGDHSLLDDLGLPRPLPPILIPKRKPGMLLRVVPATVDRLEESFLAPSPPNAKGSIYRIKPKARTIKTVPIVPEPEGLETEENAMKNLSIKIETAGGNPKRIDAAMVSPLPSSVESKDDDTTGSIEPRIAAISVACKDDEQKLVYVAHVVENQPGDDEDVNAVVSTDESTPQPSTEESTPRPSTENDTSPPSADETDQQVIQKEVNSTEETEQPSSTDGSTQKPSTEETNQTPSTEETNPTSTTEETIQTPSTEETIQTPSNEETIQTPITEKSNQQPSTEESQKPATTEETNPTPIAKVTNGVPTSTTNVGTIEPRTQKVDETKEQSKDAASAIDPPQLHEFVDANGHPLN